MRPTSSRTSEFTIKGNFSLENVGVGLDDAIVSLS